MKRQQFKVYKNSLENLYVYAYLKETSTTIHHHQNKPDTLDRATRRINSTRGHVFSNP
ncbi:MAG: hypothetical protein WCB31_12985 [Nitrososphaeraceae archaeon]